MKDKPAINKLQRIALVGNANLGKTTLFNSLCGLKQKTGNYPGVTVDKKTGTFNHNGQQVEIIDLPGINSLFPRSADEELVVDYLLDADPENYPDKLLVLANALNLKRSLYLFDQVRDLNKPTVLAINFSKKAKKRGIEIDLDKLREELGVPVVLMDANEEEGLDELKDELLKSVDAQPRDIHFISEDDAQLLCDFQESNQIAHSYPAFLQLTNNKEDFKEFVEHNNISVIDWKRNESILRYKYLGNIINEIVQVDKTKASDFTTRADKILVHPFWGYVIFILILFSIFQAIFLIASYPMDWIDSGFAMLSTWVSDVMPEGYFSDLLSKGLIPGIGGVVIFVPQIAILFFLFALIEESGYMQRIVFLMDKFMQRFGMSGKSVIPMISGMACAIPAIMSARTIENNKERLITILITPLMTCSARIPVYVVIIALIIPDDASVGIFHLQGLILMAMYLLGILMSLIVAFVLKFILKTKYKSFLLIDMPEYLFPQIKSVLLSVWTNVKSFLWNAGRIILATSIILFVLGTNGGENFKNAEEIVTQEVGPEQPDLDQKIETYKLEYSYLGMMGRTIEPAIKPLGYDWKIGIALISSLAAREVFVSTISTIYSINSEEELTIRDKIKRERSANGSLAFGFATSVSLLLFYAFALQCLSTVAVTYKETKSLKWTGIQFMYMTILAYLVSLIAYQSLI